jgi:hypothetical protein
MAAATSTIKFEPALSSMRTFTSSSMRAQEEKEKKSRSVNDLLVEDIPTEGEWAGCSKKFMAPLRVPVRGGGES